MMISGAFARRVQMTRSNSCRGAVVQVLKHISGKGEPVQAATEPAGAP